ncbi:MAG: VWA domain-containing protein [Victivallales bacterium]|nr:VWA domain-containing protein [Victivallales bacterium]
MSTYSFQPLCPAWVIAMWSLICLGLILHAWRRQRDEVPPRIRAWLLALRLVGLAFLTMLMLRPWRETTVPQPGASRVVVLADASASMFDHADALGDDGKPLRRWDAAVAVLPESLPWTAERLRFAAQGLLPWPVEPATSSALPGETAIGNALDEALESRRRPGALPLAAIVLLTDGCETAPDSSLIDAAKRAKALRIPVSTYAVGSPATPPNASVSFTMSHIAVCQDESFALPVRATSDFPTPFPAQVTLCDGQDNPLSTRQISLSADTPVELSFELTAAGEPGDHAYSVRLSGQPPQDGNPTDDRDAVVVHVEPPPRHRLLYLAANPGWEWRFLREVAEGANDLELSGILRIGRDDESHGRLPADFRPTRLFHHYHLHDGVASDAEDRGFPTEAAEYSDYDAVVLECAAAADFTPEQCAALLAFVERHGGGLLLTGNPEPLPEELSRLIPVRDFESRQAHVQSSLMANRDFIFEAEATSRLGAGKIVMPVQTRYLVGHSLKPAARVALRDDRGDALLVAMGNYGAGRIAWLGLEESWRWCLADSELDGKAIHREFWETVLAWLGQNRQPVLRPELPTDEVAVGRSTQLGIWVTGPDFLPAPAAQVQMRVNMPGQETRLLALSPSPDEIGLYQVEFSPPVPGAYAVEFSALATPEAVAVTAQAMFLAKDFSREAQETAAQPELLADVARLTGGAVLHSPVNWAELPLSREIPFDVSRQYLLENAGVACLMVLVWCLEWWLRRRHGLK